MFDTLNSKIPVCFGKLDATKVHRVLLKKRNRWIAIIAIVIVPGFHEAFALEATKIPSKLKDSGFVSMELLLKDSERVFLPISELGESVREGGTKSSGSSSQRITPANVDGGANAYECGYENKRPCGPLDYVQAIVLGLFLGMFPAAAAGLLTPNEPVEKPFPKP
jgi:hypothetical protein